MANIHSADLIPTNNKPNNAKGQNGGNFPLKLWTEFTHNKPVGSKAIKINSNLVIPTKSETPIQEHYFVFWNA